MPVGREIQHTVCSQLSERQYVLDGPLYCSLELLACDDDDPPKYLDISDLSSRELR
jgi:hypothetical protein